MKKELTFEKFISFGDRREFSDLFLNFLNLEREFVRKCFFDNCFRTYTRSLTRVMSYRDVIIHIDHIRFRNNKICIYVL